MRHWTSIEDPTAAAAILFGLHLLLALLITFHVLISRKRPQSASGWIALTWLSPFVGAVGYLVFGVNRIRRKAERIRADVPDRSPVVEPHAKPSVPEVLAPLRHSIDQIVDTPLLPGNRVSVLIDGDEAYPAMLEAIASARASIAFQTFILDRDDWGRRFVDALAAAKDRGVEVRVLLDGIGVWFSWPTIIPLLRAAGLRWDRFLWSLDPRRMAFVNLRNHRKVLVIDGRVGFTGGINIGAENLQATHPVHAVRDTHFRFEGPVVEQLTDAFADDWLFATGEHLPDEAWFPAIDNAGVVAARVVTSGPDEDNERIEFVALHAISCARKSVRVVTPYFLPPEPLTMALGLAAMRGIEVDLIIPEHGNHAVLDWARRIPLRPLIEAGCRVWLLPPPFEHSKLMTIDDNWSLVGSANWDTRSFRLNFELNVELHDTGFAKELAIATGLCRRLTVAELDADPLPIRLRNGAARLLQPYL